MTAKPPATQVKRNKAGSGQNRKKWSAEVTQHSDALDLQEGIFKLRSPRRIALSLKKSTEASHRRKRSPFRSALSMLTFYINRAGKNLPARRLQILEKSKDELRQVFGRPPRKTS
jgi:hypothetical protein